MKPQIQSPVISWDQNLNPRSLYFDDVYFNTDGAIEETTYVFIEGNQLEPRFINHTRDSFVIAETGFGSGLSFLLLSDLFRSFKKQYPHHPLQKLIFLSVEKYPLSTQEFSDIHSKLLNDSKLNELALALQADWPKTEYQFDSINLQILFDDVERFSQWIANRDLKVDAWFFDGFSPKKNPAMWSQSLFEGCFSVTHPQATFATFSAAGFVRRHLQHAGFTVNKRKGFGPKREMLVGYK